MTEAEILKKAIEKAIKNGFIWEGATLKEIEKQWIDADWRFIVSGKGYYTDIFSHSFAKAFFLDKWREMLQNMVLEEEPLKFLEKYL